MKLSLCQPHLEVKTMVFEEEEEWEEEDWEEEEWEEEEW
jgi:hypothetical protein